MRRAHIRTEALDVALDLLPEPVRRRALECDLVLGADPVFVGVHGFEAGSYGRSYRSTSHACYEVHTCDRRRAVIIAAHQAEPSVFVHEFAHIVDGTLGLEWEAVPLTDYAATNRYEAFAAAFEARFVPPSLLSEWQRAEKNRERLARLDPATLAFLESIE